MQDLIMYRFNHMIKSVQGDYWDKENVSVTEKLKIFGEIGVFRIF